jgi:hypothetical protein
VKANGVSDIGLNPKREAPVDSRARDDVPALDLLDADAIGRTLRLDRHERTHLFRLADVPDPSSPDQDGSRT